jgi:hypothetical protein
VPAWNITNYKQVTSLCRKYKKSLKGLTVAKQAYNSLTAAANSDIIKQWSAEKEDAQARWAKDVLSMDLFDVHLKQGYPFKVPLNTTALL